MAIDSNNYRSNFYQGPIDSNHVDTKEADDIYNTCEALRDYSSFFINKKGELDGYSNFNIFGRAWNYVGNIISGGKQQEKVIEKLKKTFGYLLRINTNKPIFAGRLKESYLNNKTFGYGTYFYEPDAGEIHENNRAFYSNLANKAIRVISKRDEALESIAQRLVEKETKDATYQDWIN